MLGEQRAVIAHVGEKLARLDFMVQEAQNTLRALQRDVAWDFFYGIVNFDGVFGTVNHYGTVDIFAGRFNDSYRKAELDYSENYETPVIRETFKSILADWTNATFDPFASPHETGAAWGIKNGDNNGIMTGSLTRVSGENVGNYNILQGTVDAGSNYTITYVGDDLGALFDQS